MTDKSSTLLTSIYNSRNTILKHSENLDFQIENSLGVGITELNEMYLNDQLDMEFEKKEPDPSTGNKQKIYIKYFVKGTLRPNTIYSLYEDIFITEEILSKNDILVIVMNAEINEPIQNMLKEIFEKNNVLIVVHSLKRLQFNIFDNNYALPHRILNETESIQISKKYNIMDPTQYPTISRFDPIAQAICMKPDQICEITRRNKKTLKSSYYRRCVNQ